MHLFFGCRNAEGDYLYQQEWQQLQRAGVLTGLHTAFSRDQTQKFYVTHLIRQQATLVWQLLQQVGGQCLIVLYLLLELHSHICRPQSCALPV